MDDGSVFLRLGVGAAALAAWCAFATGFPRSTVGAWVVWALSSLGVVGVGMLFERGRRGQRPGWSLPEPHRSTSAAQPGGLRVGLLPWVGVLVVIVGWEALGIDTGPRTPHLTLSALTGASRGFDAAVLFVWIAVGVGYGAARARRPQRPLKESASDALGGSLATWPAGPAPLALRHPPSLLLPGSQPAGVTFWICILALLTVIEVVARRSWGRIPTAEDLVWLTSRWRPADAVVVICWLYAGWHLFAH